MSEGNGPIPSRRALRQRRVEAESLSASAESDPKPSSGVPEVRFNPAMDPAGEATTEAAPERESQTRARSREALQAYKSLAEAPMPAEESSPPTRRQLRLRRAEAAARASNDETQAIPTAAAADVEQPPIGPSVATGPRTDERRQRQRQRQEEHSLAEDSGDTSTDPAQMSVEQALAAREALIGQAQNQAAALAASQKEDPFSVDLQVLAEQKALAERAAVLNRRAESMERLARENELARAERLDPTTAHNLAMIAPADYSRRPGVDRSIMLRGSNTTHVPVVTGRSAVAPAHTVTGAVAPGVLPIAAPEVSHPVGESEPDPAGPLAGPVGARKAYGLEPLDAVTAAGARIQRHLLMQLAVIGLGAVAIVFGLLMIFGGVGR